MTTSEQPFWEKKKKPVIPFALRVIRWSFPKLERVAPALARRWFVKLFFSPPRYTIPPIEQEILKIADRFTVMVRDIQVPCYSWGQGPVILLMHGWAGRASQFRSFIPVLTGAGYRVVAPDAPGHGRAPARQTNIFEFKDAMLEIANTTGPVEAVIAHSIGGAAAMASLVEGLPSNVLITLATPTIGDEIIEEFSKRIHASPKAGRALKDHIYRTFQRTFDSLTAAHFAGQLRRPVRWLVIHDEQDKEATIRNAWRLQESHPDTQLKITTGLGHVRILRDEQVIQTCLQFIKTYTDARRILPEKGIQLKQH